jgi:hypothetical protein
VIIRQRQGKNMPHNNAIVRIQHTSPHPFFHHRQSVRSQRSADGSGAQEST